MTDDEHRALQRIVAQMKALMEATEALVDSYRRQVETLEAIARKEGALPSVKDPACTRYLAGLSRQKFKTLWRPKHH